MSENVTDKGLAEAISNGAKAAREIGKSRERTFAIGEGLVAMRSQCLIAMGKSPRINDRAILKSGKYRELMGAALKRYPAYTLATVFKNDSTRIAYMFCAEYRSEIEVAFAEAEVANPGSTVRIVNPERMKSKFKALKDPPKKVKATKAAAKEAEAQEQDELIRRLKEDVENTHKEYDSLFERVIDFDQTPAEKLVELLLDAKATNRKNRLRFIDLVCEYATGKNYALAHRSLVNPEDEPKSKAKRPRKAKVPEEGGFAPGVLEEIAKEAKAKPAKYIVDGTSHTSLKAAKVHAEDIFAATGKVVAVENAPRKPRKAKMTPSESGEPYTPDEMAS